MSHSEKIQAMKYGLTISISMLITGFSAWLSFGVDRVSRAEVLIVDERVESLNIKLDYEKEKLVTMQLLLQKVESKLDSLIQRIDEHVLTKRNDKKTGD